MKKEMIDALMHDAEAQSFIARMNIQVLLNNPAGVGDHPNIMQTIQEQLDIVSKHKDRLSVLAEYFYEEE